MSRPMGRVGDALTSEEIARLEVCLKTAAKQREKLCQLEHDALVLGRRHGLSYDQIGAYIGVNGHTLRTRARRLCLVDYEGAVPLGSGGGTLPRRFTAARPVWP